MDKTKVESADKLFFEFASQDADLAGIFGGGHARSNPDAWRWEDEFKSDDSALVETKPAKGEKTANALKSVNEGLSFGTKVIDAFTGARTPAVSTAPPPPPAPAPTNWLLIGGAVVGSVVVLGGLVFLLKR